MPTMHMRLVITFCTIGCREYILVGSLLAILPHYHIYQHFSDGRSASAFLNDWARIHRGAMSSEPSSINLESAALPMVPESTPWADCTSSGAHGAAAVAPMDRAGMFPLQDRRTEDDILHQPDALKEGPRRRRIFYLQAAPGSGSGSRSAALMALPSNTGPDDLKAASLDPPPGSGGGLSSSLPCLTLQQIPAGGWLKAASRIHQVGSRALLG